MGKSKTRSEEGILSSFRICKRYCVTRRFTFGDFFLLGFVYLSQTARLVVVPNGARQRLANNALLTTIDFSSALGRDFEQVRRGASQIAALVDALVEGLPQAPPLAASNASAGAPPAAATAANNTSDPNTWKVAMARFAGELQSAQKALTHRRSPTPSSARATGTSRSEPTKSASIAQPRRLACCYASGATLAAPT